MSVVPYEVKVEAEIDQLQDQSMRYYEQGREHESAAYDEAVMNRFDEWRERTEFVDSLISRANTIAFAMPRHTCKTYVRAVNFIAGYGNGDFSDDEWRRFHKADIVGLSIVLGMLS